jgi:hypothetical protein
MALQDLYVGAGDASKAFVSIDFVTLYGDPGPFFNSASG